MVDNQNGKSQEVFFSDKSEAAKCVDDKQWEINDDFTYSNYRTLYLALDSVSEHRT